TNKFKPHIIYFICIYPYQILHIDSSIYTHLLKKNLGIVINKMENDLRVKVYYKITNFGKYLLILGNNTDDLIYKFPLNLENFENFMFFLVFCYFIQTLITNNPHKIILI